MFSRLLGDRDSHSVTERLLLHFERTNDELAEVLRQGLDEDESMVTIALSEIASIMDNFDVEQTEDLRTPANEAMYTYLQTLPFRHFRSPPPDLQASRYSAAPSDLSASFATAIATTSASAPSDLRPASAASSGGLLTAL